MNDSDIFIKSPAGLDEIQSRSRKLPQRLRSLLIMVDGTRSILQLRHAAASLGAPEDGLEQLVGQGLIEPSRLVNPLVEPPAESKPSTAVESGRSLAERFELTKKLMNDTAVDSLGLRAFFFTLKLEKCFTVADLEALLPDYLKAITKAKGEDAARELGLQVRRRMR